MQASPLERGIHGEVLVKKTITVDRPHEKHLLMLSYFAFSVSQRTH